MSLRKKFFNNAVPMVVSMWVFCLYTIVDGIFVAAGVGPMALASVNLAMPFVNLILGAALLFSTGAAAYISIRLGSGDLKGARQTYMTVCVTLIFLGLATTVLTLMFIDPLVMFLGAPENLHANTKGYLQVVVCFAAFQMIAYFLEVMSVTDGYPKMAMASVAIAGVFNIGLDYLFVIVLKWGVEGAAFATGLAQIASVAFLVAHALLGERTLRFCRFRYDFGLLVKSAPLGITDSITEFSVGIVVLLFNHRILELMNEEALVSYTVIAYINTLVVMTMFGLSQGMLPLVGFHHGGEEWGKVRRLLRMGIRSAVVCSVIWFVVCEVFTGVVVGMFIDGDVEPKLFGDTVRAFRIYAVAFLFAGVNVVLATWFSAVERPVVGIVVSLGRALVVAAVMLYVVSAVFGPVGIWLSAGVSEFVCLIGALLLHWKYGRGYGSEGEGCGVSAE